MRRHWRILLWYGLILVMMAGRDPARADEIIIAADEWCPVNCEAGSDRPGYMVEIAIKAFEPLGHTIRYETINWARALLYTRKGKFDAVIGALREDAPDFVFPSMAQGETQVGLFVRRSSDWTYAGPPSLIRQRVGLILDYGYGEDLQTQISALAIPSYASGDNPLDINLRKFLADRIDILVEDVGILRHRARELGVSQDIRLAHVFSREDVFIAFSPAKEASVRLADTLGAAMARLRASGELDQILARYELEDWE